MVHKKYVLALYIGFISIACIHVDHSWSLTDADGDGYYADDVVNADCDDADPEVNPGVSVDNQLVLNFAQRGTNLKIASSQLADNYTTVTARGSLSESRDNKFMARVILKKVVPVKPTVRINSAPHMAFVGDTITLSGTVTTSSTLAGKPVSAEWMMPNGTALAGENVTYTIAASDFTDDRLTVRFRGWLDGYKEESLVEISKIISRNTYVWPDDFTLHVYGSEYAPSDLTLIAKPVNNASAKIINANVTYQWAVDENADTLLENNNMLKVNVDQPGTYRFGLDISDIFNNSVNKLLDVEVLERIPSMNVYVRYDKDPPVEPVRATLIPTGLNLDPGDTIYSYSFTEPETGQFFSGSEATFEFMEGTYVVDISGRTNYNVSLTESVTIDVQASTPPVCTIDYSLSESIKTVFLGSDCADDDPWDYITGYEWYVDNNLVSNSYRASYRYQNSGVISVQLTATDKAGKQGVQTVQITLP